MARTKQSSSEKGALAQKVDPGLATEDETPPVPLTVGIGASAGGHEALERFFTTLPADCNLSLVVVMHLPAEGPSLLADILRQHTSMAVMSVEDNMVLRPNTVYVPPPGKYLAVCGDRLRLHHPEEKGQAHHPIDFFSPRLPLFWVSGPSPLSFPVSDPMAAKG